MPGKKIEGERIREILTPVLSIEFESTLFLSGLNRSPVTVSARVAVDKVVQRVVRR